MISFVVHSYLLAINQIISDRYLNLLIILAQKMSDYHAGHFTGGPSALDTEVRDLLDAQRANEDKQRWLKWEVARVTRQLTDAKIKDVGSLSNLSHHQVTCYEKTLAGFKTQLLSAQCHWRFLERTIRQKRVALDSQYRAGASGVDKDDRELNAQCYWRFLQQKRVALDSQLRDGANSVEEGELE